MVEQVNGPPELFALFGQPVAGNPTQEMIEAGFRKSGLNWRYLTIEVSPGDLVEAISGMRAMGFLGANITKPHKIAVIAHLDRLTEAAATIGAVNCIKREGESLLGENTDGKGFLESLQTAVDPRGKQVVLLGAGGAARARRCSACRRPRKITTTSSRPPCRRAACQPRRCTGHSLT